MDSRPEIRRARPANRDGSYTDWRKVRQRAESHPGVWLFVGSVKESTASAAKNGSIRAVRDLVVRTRKEGAAPGRVHVYVMKVKEQE